MDRGHPLDSRPSIRVIIATGRKRGNLFLSSLNESDKTDLDLMLPQGKIPRFYCPHCQSELRDRRRCAECKAPLIPLEREEGGLLLICARKGCKNSLVELESLEAKVKAFYDTYYTLSG